MEQVIIKFKKIHEDAVIPQYAHEGDSGMDLYTIQEEVLHPGITKVPTGVQVEIPAGYEGQIRPKSGLALNFNLTVHNTPGTIDSGYRGEVCVLIYNHKCIPTQLRIHSKIAQLVIAPVVVADVLEVQELDETTRGSGGFGSTGLQ